jgi:hypothetical protein
VTTTQIDTHGLSRGPAACGVQSTACPKPEAPGAPTGTALRDMLPGYADRIRCDVSLPSPSPRTPPPDCTWPEQHGGTRGPRTGSIQIACGRPHGFPCYPGPYSVSQNYSSPAKGSVSGSQANGTTT